MLSILIFDKGKAWRENLRLVLYQWKIPTNNGMDDANVISLGVLEIPELVLPTLSQWRERRTKPVFPGFKFCRSHVPMSIMAIVSSSSALKIKFQST